MNTDRLTSLSEIHAACWHELAQAASTRGHGWRTLALATAHSPGDGLPPEPELRTVVLREVDADARLLVVYTDSRSPKVAQLRAQPQARLLAWCPALGWQLRLRVRIAIDTGGLGVSSRWARLKMTPAAQDYLSPLPPGSQVPPEGLQPARDSREHFAVLFASVEAIDWLELHRHGHRRAAFGTDGSGRWLTP